jgi:hypothetical protein
VGVALGVAATVQKQPKPNIVELEDAAMEAEDPGLVSVDLQQQKVCVLSLCLFGS